MFYNQVKEFTACISGNNSLYGFCKDTTLESLVLTLLPPLEFEYVKHDQSKGETPATTQNIKVYILKELAHSLKRFSGLGMSVPVSLDLPFTILCLDVYYLTLRFHITPIYYQLQFHPQGILVN